MIVDECVLPTFQDIVRACNKERLVREVLSRKKECSGYVRISSLEALRAGVREAIEELCTLEISACSGLIAVPKLRFEPEDATHFARHVRAVYLDAYGKVGPRSSLLRISRKEAASCAVWLGGQSCLADRYEMLADMCWDIMENGVSSKDADARVRLRPGRLKGLLDEEWAVRVCGQWDFSEPDQVESERQKLLLRQCDMLNETANVRFLAEVADLQKYIDIVARRKNLERRGGARVR